MKTLWNKVWATVIYFLGVGSILLSEDMTGFVVCLIIALGLYFAREDVFDNEVFNEPESAPVYTCRKN
jgi:hypothetical protein